MDTKVMKSWVEVAEVDGGRFMWIGSPQADFDRAEREVGELVERLSAGAWATTGAVQDWEPAECEIHTK